MFIDTKKDDLKFRLFELFGFSEWLPCLGCLGFKEFYVRPANSRGALTP